MILDKLVDGHSSVEIPGLIPNPEVKLTNVPCCTPLREHAGSMESCQPNYILYQQAVREHPYEIIGPKYTDFGIFYTHSESGIMLQVVIKF